ncbi:hypothetical protein DYB28_008944 [Aphanomyces astaci]|uniref:Uncharacterized protein n=2 Tax=Aphanomyces astaci TaxID=112090 RepID=A0A397AIS6_APHAT|nr:hypothetical protein DYB36_003187 [Aphanomyces astaci]RHY53755.1 hypothetical protein DYB34_002983 [Aphanomyces astaci]RHY79676.1 hypothetical protein DYB31_009318 [Aphanomyces astaci]RHZ06292.1 hypothetical protein DYB26_007245 [Aphanomyces astaci]RLO07839.1 hypothetical protein DYB28_008944 [Aphanomyces astaci]
MLLSSSRSPMPSLALTPTKKRLAKPQPPQRSFLQRWNEVPSPVAKALESFIQDPNLVEKLKIVSSPSMEPPVVWRSRDAAELCAAMDASFPVAEPLDFEEMQPPLTPQDVAELTTAMEDMANLHDTVPECFDTDTPFVPLEKPPSRPEVADSLQPLGIAVDPTIFQWLPNALVTQEGEWTVLLDEDFDAKAAHAPISLSPPHNPDDGDDDQRIERSETTSSASSSDIEENEYKQATVTTVAAHKHRHRPKSILKKSVVTHPMAPVMAVGSSQFSLRKDPKHTHWKVDHDTCDDIPLGGALLPRY